MRVQLLIVLLMGAATFSPCQQRDSQTSSFGLAQGFHSNTALPEAPVARQSSPESTRFVQKALKPNNRKKLGSQYWFVMGLQAAATVADIESTAYQVSKGCVESNPIYGSKPTRTRMYAINIPILVGSGLLARWGKKDKKDSFGWWLFPVILTGVHAGAAAHNMGVDCR